VREPRRDRRSLYPIPSRELLIAEAPRYRPADRLQSRPRPSSGVENRGESDLPKPFAVINAIDFVHDRPAVLDRQNQLVVAVAATEDIASLAGTHVPVEIVICRCRYSSLVLRCSRSRSARPAARGRLPTRRGPAIPVNGENQGRDFRCRGRERPAARRKLVLDLVPAERSPRFAIATLRADLGGTHLRRKLDHRAGALVARIRLEVVIPLLPTGEGRRDARSWAPASVDAFPVESGGCPAGRLPLRFRRWRPPGV
jgi:hypothetical protein